MTLKTSEKRMGYSIYGFRTTSHMEQSEIISLPHKLLRCQFCEN